MPIELPKPLLLRVAPWILIPVAVYVLAFSVVMLLERDSAAVGPLADFGMGEQAAILVGILLSAILGAGGYGLHRDLLWARWVLTAGSTALFVSSCVFALAAAPPDIALPIVWETMQSMPYVAFAALYLFGSSNVRRYYADLEAR